MTKLKSASSVPGFHVFPMVLILSAGSFFTGCSSQSANSADLSYKRFLSISGVQSYYYKEPGTKESYPLVKGSLSNLGPESLGVVEFTLRYKDNLNREIYQEQAYPVYVSRFAGTSSTDPLTPGQKLKFAFRCYKCPHTWEAGRIDIEITKTALLEKKSS
jgi:hypothetical protein